MKEWLWAIFGNSDEWPPPGWYYTDHYPGKWEWAPDWLVRAAWLFWRNPFHNLTWHRWGIVDEKDQWEKTGPFADHVWSPAGGWNRICWTHKSTGERRMFRSYRGKRREFYWGVRESGAWGVAFRRANR